MITMENKQRVKTIAVIFIIAIVLISLITEFLYIFNNKYTYSKLQPEKGVLTLSQEEIDSNSFHFLIKDWEFYEDALLTPTYFKNQTSLPNMNMFQSVILSQRTQAKQKIIPLSEHTE